MTSLRYVWVRAQDDVFALCVGAGLQDDVLRYVWVRDSVRTSLQNAMTSCKTAGIEVTTGFASIPARLVLGLLCGARRRLRASPELR
jgi:hypothetical protein